MQAVLTIHKTVKNAQTAFICINLM